MSEGRNINVAEELARIKRQYSEAKDVFVSDIDKAKALPSWLKWGIIGLLLIGLASVVLGTCNAIAVNENNKKIEQKIGELETLVVEGLQLEEKRKGDSVATVRQLKKEDAAVEKLRQVQGRSERYQAETKKETNEKINSIPSASNDSLRRLWTN